MLVHSYCHGSCAIAVIGTATLLFHKICCILPTHPLLRAKDVEYKIFYSKESVTDAEVEPWLGCHSYLLPITSFAVWHATPTLQWSIDKLIMNMIHSEIELILINDIIFFHFLSLPCGSEERRLPSVCKARPVISVSFLQGKENKESWAQTPSAQLSLFLCYSNLLFCRISPSSSKMLK